MSDLPGYLALRAGAGLIGLLPASGARSLGRFIGRIWHATDPGRRRLAERHMRRVLGEGVIRSTLFDVRQSPEGFVFVGSGHGHGVGMSQWGAQSMAMRGASYREILAAFYPGTELLGSRP